MPSKEKKLTVVIPVEFSRDHVIVNENAVYGAPIIPESPQHLNWRIEIHKNAELKSHVFGKIVNIEENCKIGGNLFGERSVFLGEKCTVEGDVISRGEIKIASGCKIGGNIIGEKIDISNSCTVGGNIMGNEVKIDKKSKIGGLILSLKGECSLGDDVNGRDVMSNERLTLGKNVKIEDNVIWSHAKITSKKVYLAGREPNPIHFREYEGSELNLNTDRISVGLKKFDAKEETMNFLMKILFPEEVKD